MTNVFSGLSDLESGMDFILHPHKLSTFASSNLGV